MTNFSRPPTDEEIISVFTDYAARRAEANVAVAKAVAKVAFDDGRVTVVIDPAKAGAEHWTLVETASYENFADFLGKPAGSDDKVGIWLRGRVSRMEVQDIDGRPLGARSTAELNDFATGRAQLTDD
ncbi:hypothetical protein [Dietzia kunjamensis]|uniref:hypothetical protein n=1 Tax=Dietzia kunjamensis TaxID=322509 RepID=UPI0039BC57C1